jgi:hypothetical protein
VTYSLLAAVLSGATVLLATTPIQVASQSSQPVIVSGIPVCAGCQIRVSKVATLGSSADPVMLGLLSVPTRDSQGRYFAATSTGNTVAVYDAGGRLVQTVGRPGSGPGEFGLINRILVGAGDSLIVIEPARFSVFSPSFAFVRTQ